MTNKISDDTLRYAVGHAAMMARLASPDGVASWPEWRAAYDAIQDTPMDSSARIVIDAVVSGLLAGGVRDTFVVTLAKELEARRYG